MSRLTISPSLPLVNFTSKNFTPTDILQASSDPQAPK